jgi:hypothetical protein
MVIRIFFKIAVGFEEKRRNSRFRGGLGQRFGEKDGAGRLGLERPRKGERTIFEPSTVYHHACPAL